MSTPTSPLSSLGNNVAVEPPPQSEASKILGTLFIVGAAAVSIFVKNPAHVQTAGAIVAVLKDLLPTLETML